jgi:hypothetical protein
MDFPIGDGGITFDEMFVASLATSLENSENGNILASGPIFSFSSGVQEQEPTMFGGMASSSHESDVKDDLMFVVVNLFKNLQKQDKF